MSQSAKLKNQDVAERFRYFMRAKGLTNQKFLDEIQHAVTTSSLFSILNGHRKPSKSLAVLVEKLWAYRAEYLLEGKGEMWLSSTIETQRDLSLEEQEVLGFMRQSIHQAREIKLAVEKSRLWGQLYQRLQRVLMRLEQCAQSTDKRERSHYPHLLSRAFKDGLLSADIFLQYSEYHHRRRVHRLSDAFITRYLIETPQHLLSSQNYQQLQEMLTPVINKRRHDAQTLQQSISNLQTTLDNACKRALPSIPQSENDGFISADKLSQQVNSIIANPSNDSSVISGKEFHQLLAELQSEAQPTDNAWETLRQQVCDLINDFSTPVDYVATRSVQELEQALEAEG